MTIKQITLANLSDATAQEVFDFITSHLLRQNERAFTDLRGCSYRTPEGLSCAAGCLMTAEEAARNEGIRWGYLQAHGHVPGAHSELIASLQRLHDMTPAESWRDRLCDIAARNGLDFQP